ncbi:MAG: hypothetical protein ACXWE7_13430, partial [Nitrososphaeraceae archaeon]
YEYIDEYRRSSDLLNPQLVSISSESNAKREREGLFSKIYLIQLRKEYVKGKYMYQLIGINKFNNTKTVLGTGISEDETYAKLSALQEYVETKI